MGRLQRKTPESAKRKKRQRRIDEDQQSPNGGSGKEGAVVRPLRDAKKRAPEPAVKSGASGIQQRNVIQKSIQFLREVKFELKKVVWPSRKQTVGSTIVVIILVMIFALFLGGVDIGLSSLVKLVLP